MRSTSRARNCFEPRKKSERNGDHWARGGGVRALMVRPLKKWLFAASLTMGETLKSTQSSVSSMYPGENLIDFRSKSPIITLYIKGAWTICGFVMKKSKFHRFSPNNAIFAGIF